jgi:hypothetical protein
MDHARNWADTSAGGSAWMYLFTFATEITDLSVDLKRAVARARDGKQDKKQTRVSMIAASLLL